MKLTKEEKKFAEQLMYGLKILARQSENFHAIPEGSVIRNAVGELTLPTVGDVQVQLTISSDQSEWLGEADVRMTSYR